jgi:hypothetical protein
MTLAYAVTARLFRAQLRKHEFPEPCRRIVETIIEFSYDAGRLKALIPTQTLFNVLNEKLSKGRISSHLSWLELQSVIEREIIPVAYGGRRYKWTVYLVLPPEKWNVPLRVRPCQVLADTEAWLARLDPDEPELLEPPISLNELLSEDFVERAGAGARPPGEVGSTVNEGQNRVERLRPESPTRQAQSGSPGGNFGNVASKGPCHHAPIVPSEGTQVEPQGAVTSLGQPEVPPAGLFNTTGSPAGNSMVPSQGTLPAPVPRQGTSGGRGASSRSTRFEIESTESRIEYSSTDARAGEVPPQGTRGWLSNGYVRQKLQKNPRLSLELINGQNSEGKPSNLGQLFGQLYANKPDLARQLLSESLEKNNPNGWLNRVVRVELGLQPMPLRVTEWRPGQ